MKISPLAKTISALTLSTLASLSIADTQDDKIKQLEERIIELEQNLNSVAETFETAQSSSTNKVHIGGYGELHYNSLDNDGEDYNDLDFHRMVFMFGYDFSDRIRFVSELEIEHAYIGDGSVELEQAYLEFDLNRTTQLKTGVLLMPIGIISETHEPPTFYGVERPIVENKIIPTTWVGAGVSLVQKFDSGLSYDLMISEGLKTPDSNPFSIRSGRQKSSHADATELAITGRVAYRGVKGLELAAYAQYQPDLDQGAEVSYADAATLMGGHAVYQMGDFTGKALYARWDLDGAAAEAAGQDLQDGGYLELAWKPIEKWGFFVRQSAWSQVEGVDAQQTKVGVNYYPHPDIVFKIDTQNQNDDAGNSNGFNLGVGFQF